MSARYSHGHHASVLASHADRTAQNSCAYLLPHLRPGLRVLDVGCGPGSITVDLAEAVGPGCVVGIEPVAEPLVAARALAEQRGVDVAFEQASVDALPYADGSFDVVHAHQVLQHLADPVAALREMARVARPGGIVAARDADYGAMAWFPEGLERWLATYRASARANGGEPDAGRRLRAWAHAAGLTDVTVTASVWSYASPDATRWWGESWARRTLGSAFAAQAVERGLETPESLVAMSEAWRQWSRHPDGFFALSHTEILARIPARP